MFSPPTNGQIKVIAALPPTPVMADGAPGTVLLIDKVREIVVPSQPLIKTVIIPDVKAVVYFTFTELPVLNALIPIVVALETDHV